MAFQRSESEKVIAGAGRCHWQARSKSISGRLRRLRLDEPPAGTAGTAHDPTIQRGDCGTWGGTLRTQTSDASERASRSRSQGKEDEGFGWIWMSFGQITKGKGQEINAFRETKAKEV